MVDDLKGMALAAAGSAEEAGWGACNAQKIHPNKSSVKSLVKNIFKIFSSFELNSCLSKIHPKLNLSLIQLSSQISANSNLYYLSKPSTKLISSFRCAPLPSIISRPLA